jgi:L-cysteine S-thiosulfotransferase
MKTMKTVVLIVLATCVLMGCAALVSQTATADEVKALMKSSFVSRGQADIKRLDQDALQSACSVHAARGEELPATLATKLEAEQMALVKSPSDGKYLGDWKAGEGVAQSGRGLQWSDLPGSTAGGNCYACHQLDKKELSYGNIGPSLYNYGKIRGTSDAIVQYTWGKLYNSHAYKACSNMPRFGTQGILTEKQLQDVTALLLDPASPVNQ